MTDTAPFPEPSGSPRLQDFEPLLPAELIVLRAAAVGGIAKVGLQRPRKPTPEQRVRAEFLGFLARGGGAGARVKGRQLQVVGASIIGRFDLARASVPMSLWLYRCQFTAAPVLDGARVEGSVSLSGCALPGLQAEACRIDGDLDLNAGCSIDGDLRLAHARLGRDLNCERMQLRRSSEQAPHRFVADAMQIGGNAILDAGFEAVGEVRFVGARIVGDLRASRARLTADFDESGSRGVALHLDRLRVGGSVLLDAGFSAAGQVRLRQARIAGDLDCSGAAFDMAGDASWGDNSAALLLDQARIGAALILHRQQVPLQGASLADTQVSTLHDDASTWGQHHVLDGFAYARFAADAPTDAASRLDWLARQHAAHVGADFRPDPWRRAIAVLRRMGHGPSAREIAIGRERQLRRAGRIGLGAAPGLRWLARVGHAGFGLFAGYGHRPLRLLVAALAVWLLSGSAYWATEDSFAPSADLVLAQPRLAQCRTACAALPATAPTFQPFVYALDGLLPLIDLQQKRHWAPARDAFAPAVEAWTGTPLLRMLTWFEALCGWTIGLTLIATLTGLTDRDRRS